MNTVRRRREDVPCSISSLFLLTIGIHHNILYNEIIDILGNTEHKLYEKMI